MKVKLMSYQEDILKKICCDSEGMIGCKVSLGNAARLLQLGLVHLAPTRAGIEYLTGKQVLSPGQAEKWVHGMQIREGKLRQERTNRQSKALRDIRLVYAAEDAAEMSRLYREKIAARTAQSKNNP